MTLGASGSGFDLFQPLSSEHSPGSDALWGDHSVTASLPNLKMPFPDPLPPAAHPPFMPLLFPDSDADETSRQAARLQGVLDTRPQANIAVVSAIQQPRQIAASNPTLRASANHQQPSVYGVCMCFACVYNTGVLLYAGLPGAHNTLVCQVHDVTFEKK